MLILIPKLESFVLLFILMYKILAHHVFVTSLQCFVKVVYFSVLTTIAFDICIHVHLCILLLTYQYMCVYQ